MNIWLALILAALAVHRLTILLTKDDGPAWIIDRIRNLPSRKSSAWEGIRCIRCVSLWMASAVSSVLWYFGMIEAKWLLLVILALSSAAISIERLTNAPS